MEGEPITASIMAPSQATSPDSFQIPSNTQREPLRNSSNSNLPEDSYEIVEFPNTNAANSVTFEIPAKENDDDDYADVANESLGEESDAGLDSDDESDIERGNDNEDDTPFQRLASFPANFRVMYIGQNVPSPCKQSIFDKISISLSWDEAEGGPTTDIGLEKRLVICPVSNEDGKPQFECFQDSGLAICEADLTNGSFSKALEYLQKTFAKTDQDSNLVDLCIVFVPQEVDRFPTELLHTMRKLQEKVTLLPIITLHGKELTFNNEKEEKRRAIVKLIEDNGIEIFIWKADQMIEDRDHNGEFNSRWVETVYTKKVLTVNEFVSIDNQYIYEDLQLLRSRAIEFRTDRFNKERAKRRAQKCDKLVGTFKELIIMGLILYTFYLCITGVWHYAEWSVIPSDLAVSLQAVSRASLKTQNQNVHQTIPLDNGETQPLIEVSQESSSRFIFDILNKKQYFENRKNDFEVIVTHNPPQILGRYDVQEISDGRYVFDVNTTGSKGEVLVEIKEKNGSSIKIVTWVQKEDKTKSNDIKEHKEEPTFLEFVQDKAADACQNAVAYSTYAYEETKAFGTNVIVEIRRGTIYFGHQLSVFNDSVLDYVDYWVPIIWDKILNWTAIAKESIEGGYLNTKESIEVGYLNAKEYIEASYLNAKEYIEVGYLKTKEGSLNFSRFIKNRYEEIYSSF
ncbi:hypothetical protein C1645_356106 [Glomus cerebriforme]|uniref:Uncharacterized protein n=1 Tax=Glomus cerebriforme TaxID=658196 RepID=A0A397SPJ6_9GLOM|nr:hypothetical protein C1645_356106 [Glomus cerebriforme]